MIDGCMLLESCSYVRDWHRVPLAVPIRIERKSVFDVKPYITGASLCRAESG